MDNLMEPDWKVRETVEYRLVARGVETLSDVELVATIARISLNQAKKLLTKFGSLNALGKACLKDLCKLKGIHPLAAMSLICAFEIPRRKRYEQSVPLRLSNAEIAAEYIWPDMEQEEREVFKVLYLNRSMELIGEKKLFLGGVSATVIDVRLVFKLGFTHLASGIIVAHNHPSGSLDPSSQDKRITKKLKETGELFEMHLVDHLILSEKGFFSFADEGLI